jgi:thiosulfate/3-mercaptopyruvate sulfurtransferase
MVCFKANSLIDYIYNPKVLKMKNAKGLKILIFFLIVVSQKSLAQNPVNWTNDQLIEPSDLSATVKANKQLPVIFSVGPGAIIPHSKDIGMIKEAENMKKFRDQLTDLPKDTQIVVYCGCCPFEHCPNIRPAIQLLKEMKFTNYKLLDLPHNIKVDWIDKGYPTQN